VDTDSGLLDTDDLQRTSLPLRFLLISTQTHTGETFMGY